MGNFPLLIKMIDPMIQIPHGPAPGYIGGFTEGMLAVRHTPHLLIVLHTPDAAVNDQRNTGIFPDNLQGLHQKGVYIISAASAFARKLPA